MKTLEAPPDDTQFLALLDEAVSEPILIQRNEKDAAVLLSADAYRLHRASELEAFFDLCARMSAYAQAQGLTEEKLAEILADDSD